MWFFWEVHLTSVNYFACVIKHKKMIGCPNKNFGVFGQFCSYFSRLACIWIPFCQRWHLMYVMPWQEMIKQDSYGKLIKLWKVWVGWENLRKSYGKLRWNEKNPYCVMLTTMTDDVPACRRGPHWGNDYTAHLFWRPKIQYQPDQTMTDGWDRHSHVQKIEEMILQLICFGTSLLARPTRPNYDRWEQQNISKVVWG